MSDGGTTSKPAVDQVSREQFLRLSVGLTIVLLILAAVLPRLFGRRGVWTKLQLQDLMTWQPWLSGIFGLIVGAAVGVLVLRWDVLRAVEKRLAALVDWETFGSIDYALVALMAAWGEELLFRGALQPVLGLVPTAVIFGLLHATTAAHVVLAGLLGLWLGWLLQWSGSLWSPVVAHFSIDLMAGLILGRRLQTSSALRRGD